MRGLAMACSARLKRSWNDPRPSSSSERICAHLLRLREDGQSILVWLFFFLCRPSSTWNRSCSARNSSTGPNPRASSGWSSPSSPRTTHPGTTRHRRTVSWCLTTPNWCWTTSWRTPPISSWRVATSAAGSSTTTRQNAASTRSVTNPRGLSSAWSFGRSLSSFFPSSFLPLPHPPPPFPLTSTRQESILSLQHLLIAGGRIATPYYAPPKSVDVPKNMPEKKIEREWWKHCLGLFDVTLKDLFGVFGRNVQMAYSSKPCGIFFFLPWRIVLITLKGFLNDSCRYIFDNSFGIVQDLLGTLSKGASRKFPHAIVKISKDFERNL